MNWKKYVVSVVAFLLVVSMIGASGVSQTLSAADADGAALLEQHCASCHGLGRTTNARKTESEWETTVSRMAGLIAEDEDLDDITADEQMTLVAYLAENYGPELSITKTVDPETISAQDAEPTDILTYTVTISNSAETTATVTLVDALPDDIAFVGWVGDAPDGVVVVNDVITWTGVISENHSMAFVFNVSLPGPGASFTIMIDEDGKVTNSAYLYDQDGALLGMAYATTEFLSRYYIYLPLVTRNFSGGQ